MNNIRQYFDLFVTLTWTQISERYKKTSIGFLWIAIYPLIQMVIMGTVFTFFIKIQIDNYFLFLFSGIILWTFFSGSILEGVDVVIANRALVHKSNFPKSILVFSMIASHFFNFLISSLLLIVLTMLGELVSSDFPMILTFFGKILLFFPFVVVMLIVLTSGLVLAVSALNVKNRDVGFFVRATMPLMFYLSPVLYSVDFIPSKVAVLWYLNPMTALLESTRFIFFHIQPYSPFLLLFSFVFPFLIFFIGLYFFSSISKNFDDWL